MAERLQRGGAVAELLAGALRQSCWPGRCGKDAAAREIHREEGKKHARTKSRIGNNMLLSFQMNKI